MTVDFRCKYSPSLKIAITGSSGFIGRHLVETFNVNDFQSMPLDEVQDGAIVIHLAANVSNSREALLDNIAIDSSLVQQVNQHHRYLLYASSNNVYPYALDCRVNELTRCNDYYSASKIFGEKLISDMSTKPFVLLRVADVFGSGQIHGNFFRAIEAAIVAETPLQQFGAGLKRRSYIHISELCKMVKFISQPNIFTSYKNRALNLGYSDSATIGDIIKKVSRVTNLPINYVDLELETSGMDVRTMTISTLPGYEPIWPSFDAALTSYIKKILIGSV